MWKPNISMPRVEVPEFTRCCFCIPLRHGLLVWGYLKTVLLSFLAYEIIKDMIRWGGHISSILIICMILADIAFSFVFIVAGHLKHERLFIIYYYYSIGLLCTYTAFLMWFICWNWYGYFHFSVEMVLRITLEIITAFLPVLIIQGYVTLMVRTEVKKLANNSNFEFVNNASEATCSMDLTLTKNGHDNATTT